MEGHRERSLPGGPGTGSNKTSTTQMPDTLALNVNSRVRVADVCRPGRDH
jgi:ABC-type transporter Mla subunit MlaD